MLLRDEKKELYSDIRFLGVPYTITNVGDWSRISVPVVPSGRVDYTSVFLNDPIHGDGIAPNLLTDLGDFGRFVAHIICEGRTLNIYVYTFGDVLNESEIYQNAEELSGEKPEATPMSTEQIEDGVAQAKAAFSQDP
ncbi:hypothetical protein PDIDSM_8151 [Penicillium digitatum]|nr:hypothetical protein PDIDSM_8151 [Penicillium digitatum]